MSISNLLTAHHKSWLDLKTSTVTADDIDVQQLSAADAQLRIPRFATALPASHQEGHIGSFAGQLYYSNGATWDNVSAGGGTGDIVGPATSTADAIVRYSGTTGKIAKDSGVIIADATDDMTFPANSVINVDKIVGRTPGTDIVIEGVGVQIGLRCPKGIKTDRILAITNPLGVEIGNNFLGSACILAPGSLTQTDFLTVKTNLSSETVNTNLTMGGNGTGVVEVTDRLDTPGISFDAGTTIMSRYEELSSTYTFDAANNGMVPIPAPAIEVTRIGRVVSFNMDGIIQQPTSAVASVFASTQALPLAFRPLITQSHVITVRNNGVWQFGRMLISVSGLIQIFSDAGSAVFTGQTVATSGWLGISVSYPGV